MALLDKIRFSPPSAADPGRQDNPSANGNGGTIIGHTEPYPDADQQPMPRAGTIPRGQSGRANFWGLPSPDEINPQLIGPAGLRRYDDMYRTDAHVRRLVLAAWSPIVAGTWTLEPYGGDQATDLDRKIAEDIWWGLTEYMSPNFTEHLIQAGPLLLRSGFLGFEEIWGTAKRNSKTLLMPRKLDVRLPRSVWKWWQDDFGELTYIGQILPNGSNVIIPATDLLYYRLGAEGDNWQGVSLLRHAYKHWYLKDKLERIDAVGQERKAVGVPICYPPKGASSQQKAAVELLLANLHLSEVAYLMMPGPKAGSQGANGVPQDEWLIDIIQFDSSSGEGIMNSIAYHQTAIAASFLTDFLELGHHQVGARATAEVQEDPFLTAINGALLPPILPPLNKLIDRIRRVNWSGAEGSPTLKLTLHDEASLSEIAAYVVPLIQSEAIQVDPELEDYLRNRGSLPAANAELRTQREQAQQQAAAAPEPAVEPPAQPDATKPNPIGGAVEKTGEIPEQGKALEQLIMLEAGQDGCMVALVPDEPFKGVDESARRQHLTLAYLGKSEDLSGAQHKALGHIAAAHAARMAPVKGTVTGTVSFDEGAHVALIDAPGLSADTAKLLGHLRDAGLPVSGKHDFLPHVTYSYKDGRNPPVKGAAVKFSHLVVARAGRRQKIPLVGEPRKLDAPAPMSAGTTTADGLQMVPEVGGQRRTVCVDFDGVIHPKGENDSTELKATPIPGAAAGLIRLAKSYQVTICTARTNLEPVRAYLRAHAMGQFAGSVTNIKPPAVAYVDDRAVPFNSWSGVEASVRRQAKQLDAAPPPPNLRVSDSGEDDQPEQECGTCKMFDEASGTCWGYGNHPVSGEWVCDSWALSDDWQAQDTEQDEEDAEPDESEGPEDQPISLDAGTEPTARWFDRLLSQDRLREAMDGARGHIQAAAGPATLTAARKLANQAANGAKLNSTQPPSELIDALATHYGQMYQLGQETVASELAKQRRAKGRQLDDPADPNLEAAAAAGSRLPRVKARAEHSAGAIWSAVQQRLGAAQISDLKDGAGLKDTAETVASGQLRMEALTNTAALINDGRYDAAMAAPDVVGGIYTSVMDERSCDPCAEADTGDVLSPDDAAGLGPPNPDCEGGDYCRCTIVWVTDSDPAALGL